jgi:hypothetical protein
MSRRRDRSRPYRLEGSLLESCSCRAPCPCWIGADPDTDVCQGFNAYRIDRGTIDGVSVSGCNFVRVFEIPGNVQTVGSWRQVFVIDARASGEQLAAILAAYHGELGGPLADLARLVRETSGVERAQIDYALSHGRGFFRAGELVTVSVTPYTDDKGVVTTLCDSQMAGAPRAPAYVARADRHTVSLPDHAFDWTFMGRSAIQSDYLAANDV